jgi:hypothetical protein
MVMFQYCDLSKLEQRHTDVENNIHNQKEKMNQIVTSNPVPHKLLRKFKNGPCHAIK